MKTDLFWRVREDASTFFLYHGKFIVGDIEHDTGTKRWVSRMYTDPSGKIIGHFLSQTDAKLALETAVIDILNQ